MWHTTGMNVSLTFIPVVWHICVLCGSFAVVFCVPTCRVNGALAVFITSNTVAHWGHVRCTPHNFATSQSGRFTNRPLHKPSCHFTNLHATSQTGHFTNLPLHKSATSQTDRYTLPAQFTFTRGSGRRMLLHDSLYAWRTYVYRPSDQVVYGHSATRAFKEDVELCRERW